jgi:aspartyl aminopeptidase
MQPKDKKLVSDDTKNTNSHKKSKDKYKNLLADYPNLWESRSQDDFDHAFAMADEYKRFLDSGKTEREFVSMSIESVEQLGYIDISTLSSLSAGHKVYQSIKGKGLMLAVIGKKPITEGMNILGSHIDSPRLDLKPNPLYEENELTYLKTHYYGGIKKYQWPTIPLAIHGLLIRQDGSKIFINIGEKEDDPIFYITDLLPHLGTEQMNKKASEVIKGEDLNLLIGGRPIDDKDATGRFKLGVLDFLNKEYGMVEKDFVSAELEIVPALKARDVGFDRSFVAAYGHDDKVCAFPALMALMQQERPSKTNVVMLSDKEEIGSFGNSGAQSRLYENFLVELFVKSCGVYDEFLYRKTIAASKMLSADVSNGFDPTFSSVSDPKNSAYMSHGIMMSKYVGSRGKSGTNDANSEFFSDILRAFARHNIPWQTGELGKVDAGGGGTIAVYMANMGMEVIDCGVPVLSMHAPYEVISKIDLYYTYLAYKTFLEEM